MAKSKALVAAELEIAALKARLVVATTVYHNQRAQIAALEARANTRGAKAVAVKPTPVVTTFVRRDGVVCRKTRVGNMATIQVVAAG